MTQPSSKIFKPPDKYGSPVGSVDSVDSSAFLILPFFPFPPPEQQQGA
jgi:hypothetical protein